MPVIEPETLPPMGTAPTTQKSQVPVADPAGGVTAGVAGGVTAGAVCVWGTAGADAATPPTGARATSGTWGPRSAHARLIGRTYACSSTSSSSYCTVRPAVGTPIR